MSLARFSLLKTLLYRRAFKKTIARSLVLIFWTRLYVSPSTRFPRNCMRKNHDKYFFTISKLHYTNIIRNNYCTTFKMTKTRLEVNQVFGHTSVGFLERLVKQAKLVKTAQQCCERTLFTKKTEFRGVKRWRIKRFKRVSTTRTTEFEEVSNFRRRMMVKNFFFFALHWGEDLKNYKKT